MGIFGSPFFLSMILELVKLFWSCLLSATIIPFPSEVYFLFFITHSTVHPLLIISVASLGNCLGGATNYFLGRFAYSRLKVKTSTKSKVIVAKYGIWSALISWVPLLGDPILVLLGFYKTQMFYTLTLMSLGKILRYCTVYWLINL